jgi:hypothetical protein
VHAAKGDGLARGINCAVEIIPLLLDCDVRVINAIRVIGLGEMGATALVECRRIPLDPSKHCGVIDGDPAFPQQLFDITIAQGIAERLPDPRRR